MIDQTTLGLCLIDHLAGSAAALAMMQSLAESREDAPLRDALAEVTRAVEEDQTMLGGMLGVIGVDESVVGTAAGRRAEKAACLKNELTLQRDDGVTLLKALDALTLGVLARLALRSMFDAMGAEFRATHTFRHLITRVRQPSARREPLRCMHVRWH